MIIPLVESVAGSAVYVNPRDKVRDGEVIRVRGDHRVAGKLAVGS